VRPHVPCAGAIVFATDGRLLLIQRGHPPAQGSWSLPGGRCEDAEAPEQACVREVAEETGLQVRVSRWVGHVDRDGSAGCIYDIDDFLCTVIGGTLRPGDDARDARWVSQQELAELPLAPLLRETLREWDCLPRC
jgi:ADP-ribose pyrophosphatase YjhB (NUDIX family)